MILYMLYLCLITQRRWLKQNESCTSYDKLCGNHIILTLVRLMVPLYELYNNARTSLTWRTFTDVFKSISFPENSLLMFVVFHTIRYFQKGTQTSHLSLVGSIIWIFNTLRKKNSPSNAHVGSNQHYHLSTRRNNVLSHVALKLCC